MTLDITAKQLLVVAGVGLLGLSTLAACDDGDDSAAVDTSATEAEADTDDTEAEAAADEAPVDCENIAPAVAGAGADPDAPLRLCEAGQVGDWDLAVLEVELDATDAVMEANMFNEEPADGSQYLMFTLHGVNNGAEAADPYVLFWAAVNSGDNRYEESCGVVPDDMLDVGNVQPGESFTANECVAVDSTRVDDATLAMSELFDWDQAETHYRLS